MFNTIFQHHPDGFIYIRKDGKEYWDTLENFTLDLGQLYPGLPEGYIERIYVPGIIHVLGTGHDHIPQPLEWTKGDMYINKLSELISAKYTRLNPPAPALTAEEIKSNQLSTLDAQYQPQFQQLQLAWAAAQLDGDTTLADSIKADYVSLKTEYQTKWEAILNG